MTVELLSVGTELLLGNIVNTNAQYLSRVLAGLGMDVFYQTTVGDNPQRMRETIRTALSRAQMVIMTGGLGPTEDDITKDICCEELGVPMHEDAAVRAGIEDWLRKAGRKNIPSSVFRQSLVPEGAVILPNTNGTAPGLIIEKDGRTAVLLPGPPGEMKPMVEKSLVPYLQAREDSVLETAMIKICGPGESDVEQRILDLIDAQTNPTIATYAKPRDVEVRVTAKAKDAETARALLRPVVEEICSRFGRDVFTLREEEYMEHVVVAMLKERGLTLSAAESCTGGMVASRIVNVPGASDVFHASYITYSDDAKNRLTGVPWDILNTYGAVSAECAGAMAEGAAREGHADIGVSVTGYAGPDGDQVGLVYAGCSFRGVTVTEEYHFRGNRDKIREQSAIMALNLARKRMLEAAE